MILKPNEAKQLSHEQEEFMGTMERRIDDWLSREYSEGKNLSKEFKLSKGDVPLVVEKVTNKLSDTLRSAGWNTVEIRKERKERGMATDWGIIYHVLRITLARD